MSGEIVTTVVAEVAAELSKGSAAAGAMSFAPLNITVFFSVITVCIAVITIALKIFGEKTKINEQTLRESQVIIDINAKLADISTKSFEKIKETQAKADFLLESKTTDKAFQSGVNEELRLANANVKSQIEILKLQNEISNKSIEELKRDNKDLVHKLEDLVKQLYDYLSQSN